jgi:hypothetical protein
LRDAADGGERGELVRVSPGFLGGLYPEEIMRAIVIALSLAAGVAFATQSFAQVAGGGGTPGGASGAGATGAGTGASGSSSTTAPIQPPAPFSGQTNPGVTPGAPGPSQANVPRGTSPTVRQPGYASSHRQPRGHDVPQDDASSSDPIKELDKELDRKLSICRGC